VPDHVIETADGRRIQVLELGTSDGVPIVFHHGTPGSRKAHNQKVEVLAGSRAIFYDRPGYGGSDPHPGRDVAATAADVATIADVLGIERFAVSGISGGGPFALACAALLGERVTRVAVIAGFGPSDAPDLDYFDGMSEGNIAEMRAAQEGATALTQQLERVIAEAGSDPDVIIDSIIVELPEPDQRALARADIRAVFRETIGESVRGGIRGWIDDDLAFVRPWGFDVAEIQQEVLLLQGEFDLLVPRGHMNYLSSKLPNARLELIPGGGHTIFDELQEVVDWLIRAGRRGG
jgi:pimeloyl-ACP methyl ester carboxylesterase